jgi:hypothetical protein
MHTADTPIGVQWNLNVCADTLYRFGGTYTAFYICSLASQTSPWSFHGTFTSAQTPCIGLVALIHSRHPYTFLGIYMTHTADTPVEVPWNLNICADTPYRFGVTYNAFHNIRYN